MAQELGLAEFAEALVRISALLPVSALAADGAQSDRPPIARKLEVRRAAHHLNSRQRRPCDGGGGGGSLSRPMDLPCCAAATSAVPMRTQCPSMPQGLLVDFIFKTNTSSAAEFRTSLLQPSVRLFAAGAAERSPRLCAPTPGPLTRFTQSYHRLLTPHPCAYHDVWIDARALRPSPGP